MEAPRSQQPDQPASAFLVERYIPAGTAERLADSVARVARICARGDGDETGVRYLQSVYLPSEETCFCTFQGPSKDAIRAVNDDADFALDRITSGVLMATTQPNRRKTS